MDESRNSMSLKECALFFKGDPFAENEMVRWSDRTGNELIETKNEGNLYHFLVRKRRG